MRPRILSQLLGDDFLLFIQVFIHCVNSRGETPVPILNTEAKPFGASALTRKPR